MLLSVSEPNHHTPSGIPRLLPFILLRPVPFYLWPSSFLKQPYPPWRPTPCTQKYCALHQLKYLILCGCCVASVFLVVYPGRLIFRGFISPWNWLVIFCMVAIAGSLVERWLLYSYTWVIIFMLMIVRLVTASLYSNVACVRFSKASLIPTRLLAPYPPWRNVCCRFRSSAWYSIK